MTTFTYVPTERLSRLSDELSAGTNKDMAELFQLLDELERRRMADDMPSKLIWEAHGKRYCSGTNDGSRTEQAVVQEAAPSQGATGTGNWVVVRFFRLLNEVHPFLLNRLHAA